MTKGINTLLDGFIVICIGLFCCSCTNTQNFSNREPYPGFVWKDFSGAGLKMRVQENSSIKFTSNSDTVFIQQYSASKKEILQPVIKVYKLKNNNINSLLSILNPVNPFNIDRSWYDLNNCEFFKFKQDKDTEKYILKPKGDAESEMNKLSPQEPIPHTCGGFGVGNSGARYFIIFKKSPSKAVFVEIGQDAPLFDEESIKFID